jgi:hypothetical protein
MLLGKPYQLGSGSVCRRANCKRKRTSEHSHPCNVIAVTRRRRVKFHIVLPVYLTNWSEWQGNVYVGGVQPISGFSGGHRIVFVDYALAVSNLREDDLAFVIHAPLVTISVFPR